MTSILEDGNEDASLHSLSTVPGAPKNTDTDFNAYKDKRKALDHMRNLALTDFDENKKVQKTRKKCLKS